MLNQNTTHWLIRDKRVKFGDLEFFIHTYINKSLHNYLKERCIFSLYIINVDTFKLILERYAI